MEAHPPAECVRVLQDEAKEIEGYLAGLRPEEWMKQSACDGWQVRDVAAHLAGGAEIHLGMIIRGLEGDASPGPGPARRDSDAASAATAQRAVGLREQLGPGLLDTFAANYGRFGRVLQGLGPRDWEKLAWHQPRGAISLHAHLELRIQELAIHGWDIRSKIEPQAHLSPRCLPILMGTVWPWLGRTFRPRPRLPSPVVYRFDVTGPISARHDIDVEGDEFKIGHRDPKTSSVGESRTPSLTYSCDTDTFILYLYGRLNADDAVPSGKMYLEGDVGQASQFERWFKGA